MSLTPDEVKRLLAVKPKARKKKGDVDPNVRMYQTWFKLGPRAFGDSFDMSERPRCDNPNCKDTTRTITTAMGTELRVQHTVVINGVRMCRRCFLDGYGLTDEAQLTI